MRVIAFEATIENDVIRIPKEYRGDDAQALASVTILFPNEQTCGVAQTKDDAWERMLCSMRNADMVENFRTYSKDEINDRCSL